MEIKDIHLRYVREEYDSSGKLVDFDLELPENFNFAYDIIDEIAKAEPERRALIWTNDHGEEKVFTYGDLKRESDRAANMLTAHGVKKGDRVMCVLRRHYQVYFAVFALCKIGAVVIPATSQLKKKDFSYRFRASGAKYIIAAADAGVPENIEMGLEDYGGISEKFLVCGSREGWTDFDAECARFPGELSVRYPNSVDDDMLMFFSSGTTGNPKLIVHAFHYPAAHILTAKHWHSLNADSIHLTISDSGWAKFFWGKIYGQLALGCTVFVYDFERFVPARVLEKIEKYKLTSLCCPPTMLRFFIKEGMGDYDLSSLEYATTAGEALNAEVLAKFREYTGLSLMEGFGQSETIVILANLTGDEVRPGSMGKPVPLYDVILVDENDNEVPAGRNGEICIRLDTKRCWGLFKRYDGNGDNTGRAKRHHLYHTGDTAYKDEDGYFHYVGRIDDVIKSSGYRIGPFEIESILMEHPAVREAAVTAVPDPIRGNVVKATVTLTEAFRQQAGPDLAKELQNYVKNTTAPYKYPRIVEFADELPKTFSGKIRRAEIRERDLKKLG